MHNSRTQHLQKLLLHTGRLLGELQASPSEGALWQSTALRAGNALVLCQVLLKFAAEKVASERMRRLVADVLTDGGAHGAALNTSATHARKAGPLSNVLFSFSESLLAFLAVCPVKCVSPISAPHRDKN